MSTDLKAEPYAHIATKTPSAKSTPLTFTYVPSADGFNLNLLVLFHGLGDTQEAFARLGQKLGYPQTAILAIRAPEPVPLMEGCYQWFPSFDLTTGEMLGKGSKDRLNGLQRIRGLVARFLKEEIVGRCGFQPDNVFLFGFSQGATVALDVALFGGIGGLSGVVSISGYLLEDQEEDKTEDRNASSSKFSGHILVTQGLKDGVIGPKDVAVKRLQLIKEFCQPSAKVSQIFIANKDHIMPNSELEWRAIHTFFSQNLARRNLQLESMSDVYEIKR